MRKLRCAGFILPLVLAASSASAASFIVPSDRELVHAAKAIVIATAQGSYAEPAAGDMINTVYVFTVDEVIKGDVPPGQLRVVEPGGFLGGRGVLVPGAPRYATGERALMFLDTTPAGDFRTWSMGIGKFNFVRDLHGKRLLMRGQGDDAIFGWDAAGNVFHDRFRAEEKFLQFVRDVACGGAGDSVYTLAAEDVALQRPVKAAVNASGFHACDYAFNVAPFCGCSSCGGKWKGTANDDPGIFDRPGPGGSANFKLVGTQAGVDGPAGVDAGMAAWNNDSLTNVNLGVSPSGSSSINFDDAPGTGQCGAAAVGCTLTSYSGSPFNFDGGSFIPIVGASVSFKPGFTGNQTLFNQVAAHELGHSIGLRHSDAGTPSNGSAIMVAVANANAPIGANLQQWDVDAVQTLYNPSPGGATCTPPGVPTAQANPTSITAGNSAQLSATATGTAPLTFTWFTGSSPDTSTQVGTGQTINVTPSVATSYWVRVTGPCGTPQDSASVRVAVQQPVCQPPANVVAGANPGSIPAGSTTQLTVTNGGTAPFTYQWFTGNPPNGTSINGATSFQLQATPAATTTFFVVATNACGSQTSNAVTVTVIGCQNVQITQQPFASPSSILPGGTTQVSVGAIGTGLTFQWFFGTKGNTANPINGATGATFTANPAQTTSYWVRVSGQCGSPQDGETVTVTVAQACVNPGNAVAAATPSTISAGQSSTLGVTATGTGLSFQWFTGLPPNGTAINGATSAQVPVTPSATTTYYARVSGQCGTPIFSNTVTVTVSASCVPPSITTQPKSTTVIVGATTTLSVVAAGTAPLHYQWFEGATGDTSKPRGTDSATFTTASLSARTQFWVQVRGNCGQPANSNTATVDVKGGRSRPVRH